MPGRSRRRCESERWAAGAEADQEDQGGRGDMIAVRVEVRCGGRGSALLPRARGWKGSSRYMQSPLHHHPRLALPATDPPSHQAFPSPLNHPIESPHALPAQVNSRKLYVEQQRNKTLLQQRRLQQSIAEKQVGI